MAKVNIETISLVKNPDTPTSANEEPNVWWENYFQGLSNLSLTAREVLNLDSSYIVDNGIFGVGGEHGDYSRWPSTRLRKGLVMGAVQSGKTASLLGVVAKALDRGVDIVVVLAGTRTALWKQTYRRLLSQLDRWTIEEDPQRRLKRTLLPRPAVVSDDMGLGSIYFETPNIVSRALLKRRPLIAVVMKQPDHLEKFAKFSRSIIEEVCEHGSQPINMMVVDDEADDGSILDRDMELGEPIDSVLRKQIPRRIARLWSNGDPGLETFHSRLYCTYIAYTATPQSNFLQADHNPLTPTDFLCALRVPGANGELLEREPSFLEMDGLGRYYTGGEVFYQTRDSRRPLCEVIEKLTIRVGESLEDLNAREVAHSYNRMGDALRSYFVSGAIRLHSSKRRFSDIPASGVVTEEFCSTFLPAPHSMLVHPSAQISSHFETAESIAAWSGAAVGETVDGAFNLSSAGLKQRLCDEEPQWKAWLERFRESKAYLSDRDGAHGLPAPSDVEWPEIRRILEEEVFPNVRIAVINSDQRSDDSPDFSPQRVEGGGLRPPHNIYTIFVSGNVMSRGLTLEGLTTCFFLRGAVNPAADTQMQMQRWFGYRGAYLNLCRIFLYEEQLQLFCGYHEADEALRREILNYMNEPASIAPKPIVLQGVDFRATGKITNLRALPLSPGADVFLKVAETGSEALQNERLLSNLLGAESWDKLSVDGIERGIYVERKFSLLEVAELLEQFRYARHRPTSNGMLHRRWTSLARQHGIGAPEAPLFRTPHIGESVDLVAPRNCPYTTAAYLRLWHALLSRRAPGICPTDQPATPWSAIDLTSHRASAPRFTIGVRFGSAGLATDSVLKGMGIMRMERAFKDGVFRSTWGSRNPGPGVSAYLGDQLFDYQITGKTAPQHIDGEPYWRPRGEDGLVLFHVVVNSEGPSDVITAGIVLPLGGPDHIAAFRGIN